MKKKWIIIGLSIMALTAIGLVIYFNFGLSDSTQGEEGQSQARLPGVRIPGVRVGGPGARRGFPGNASDSADTASAPVQRRYPIRPAGDDDTVQISATGNIALLNSEILVSKIEALVTAVHAEQGDAVNEGDILLELEVKDLAQAVEDARVELLSAQSELKALIEPSTETALVAAETELIIALEGLADTQAGPTEVELYAAETNVFAAWAGYNSLRAGQTEDDLVIARNSLRQAESTLRRAQEAYDAISWRHGFYDEEAKALESATIAYENAKASYNQSIKPATEAELRQTYSNALEAQKTMADLKQKPTPQEVAEAELRVVQAEEALTALKEGPQEDELVRAEMNVRRAELALEDAEARLTYATLTAPFSGTVIEVTAKEGQTAEINSEMVTLANLNEFKLEVSVAEANINRLSVGQPAQVTLDALPGQIFDGNISYISPINAGSGEGGVISYDVTIQLTETDLQGILAGMTAVVAFVDEALEGKWLVPTVALVTEGDRTTVTVFRRNEPLEIAVKPGIIQGEWTVVEGPDLQAGDEVEAALNSFLDEDFPFGRPGR